MPTTTRAPSSASTYSRLTQNNMLNIQQFHFSPHPYLLPNFMDVFTWSIPFVGEKGNPRSTVMEIFYSIVKPAEGLTYDSDEENPPPANFPPKQTPQPGSNPLSARASEIQSKIRSVAKILKMQRVLREKSEELIAIKTKFNNKLPTGLLMEGEEGRTHSRSDLRFFRNEEVRPQQRKKT